MKYIFMSIVKAQYLISMQITEVFPKVTIERVATVLHKALINFKLTRNFKNRFVFHSQKETRR